VDDSGPKYNAHSWNTNANIFFIEQPVGVGFSYADFGETVVSPCTTFQFIILILLASTRQKRLVKTSLASLPSSLNISHNSKDGNSTLLGNPSLSVFS